MIYFTITVVNNKNHLHKGQAENGREKDSSLPLAALNS